MPSSLAEYSRSQYLSESETDEATNCSCYYFVYDIYLNVVYVEQNIAVLCVFKYFYYVNLVIIY